MMTRQQSLRLKAVSGDRMGRMGLSAARTPSRDTPKLARIDLCACAPRAFMSYGTLADACAWIASTPRA